ncbi:MAG TPA: SMP-30/gluconolactonase/LRE family protein [Planctomycetota bacterium]|nr:SMP-30/gluconolactonase/LRE family protein [Planctomycetota bacterium]
MRMTAISGLLGLLLGASGIAASGEPAFTAKPAAVRDGDKVKITFAVSAPTDAEVAVLGPDGKVVRHLAAGVLGDKAPEPLKPGLAQELVWDGKADGGKPAGAGPFKVRVALGLKPALDRMVGDNPAWTGSVVGLACDGRNGELFVFHNFGSLHPDDNSTACSVFGRDGAYLRTIYPWPANLPEEKLAGLKRVDLDGRKIPFVYDGELRSLIPGVGSLICHQGLVTPDGRLVFVNHEEWCSTITRYNHPGIKRAAVINAADGSMPAGGPVRTLLCKGSQAPAMLACSPDAKTFYAAGLLEGYGEKPSRQHALWKFTLDDKEAAVFIGDPAASGAGKDRFNLPLDVATDKDGNVYVADNGNNRVAVFKPDGELLGEMKVEGARRVKVSRKTGAVYVVSGSDTVNRLSRFASWKDAQPAATAVLSEFKYAWTARAVMMALDDSAEPHVVWFSSTGGGMAKKPFKVLRLEDKGAGFSDAVDIDRLPANDRPEVGPVMMLSLDRLRNRLFVNGQVWDPASDKFSPGVKGSGGGKGGMGSVGLDGNVYLMGYERWLTRYGPDLKLLPFPDDVAGKLPKGQLEGPPGGTLRLRSRGVTADPAGNIFALWQRSDPTSPGNKDPNWLTLHGPDGKIKNEKLIDSDTRGLASPRLDAQGNIYLTLGARPKGVDVPESFKGQDLGIPWKSRGINTNDINWYHLMYGSIVKFPPEGGVVRKGSGGTPVGYSYGLETEVKGAKWIFYGASSVPSWRQMYPDTCLCEAGQFDVDEYGRSFFSDALRFRVGMLDTGGNLIGWFGEYGNVDSAGPKSKVPAPAIPVLWPENIAAGNGMVYVGDRINRRVVAVKLGHAAEESCEVK